MDETLRTRLTEVGLDPDDFGDPGSAWLRLRGRFGRAITLVDRYALEAARRGVEPHELDLALRDRLLREAFPVLYPGLEFTPSTGRRRDPIEVVPYSHEWRRTFTVWREHLQAALGRAAVRIEHVGSTAVPGLPAKAVVDIQVSVLDVDDEASYAAPIARLGVPLRSREPGHRYFRPVGNDPRTIHIHVCEAGGAWEREHLLFRDFLRADAATRERYACVKTELARRYRDDRIAYTEAKTRVILDALEEAERWAEEVGWTVPAPTPRS